MSYIVVRRTWTCAGGASISPVAVWYELGDWWALTDEKVYNDRYL